MLGLDASSKTTENLTRTGECVLNLPSVANVGAVNRLARLTGRNPVPAWKVPMGYRYEKNKFEIAGLTRVESLTVAPPRTLECPIQLEAVIAARHRLMEDDEAVGGALNVFEARIRRVHLHPDLLMDGNANRIDPDKWRPLIMSFQRFYGLGDEVHESTLARIPEESYRPLARIPAESEGVPDIDRAGPAELLAS